MKPAIIIYKHVSSLMYLHINYTQYEYNVKFLEISACLILRIAMQENVVSNSIFTHILCIQIRNYSLPLKEIRKSVASH